MDGELAAQIASFLASYNITAENALAALAVVVAGWVLNKLSNFLIDRRVRKRGASQHASKSAKKMSAYIIYPLTFVAVLGVFGIPLSALGAAIGLIGLGVSFALKDMIANFVSGVLLMVNQPFKIGDQIEVEGEEGTVKDIRLRASEIKTYDGRKVIVPNSALYNGTVINHTAYDKRRFNVIVGVSYGDDIERAKELAEQALQQAEGVESNPGPQVLVDGLGDSSVNLKLRGWTHSARANLTKASSEVTQLVKQKYDQEGIDIPYPIRTVFMDEE